VNKCIVKKGLVLCTGLWVVATMQWSFGKSIRTLEQGGI
jgi:hypothetical protein